MVAVAVMWTPLIGSTAVARFFARDAGPSIAEAHASSMFEARPDYADNNLKMVSFFRFLSAAKGRSKRVRI